MSLTYSIVAVLPEDTLLCPDVVCLGIHAVLPSNHSSNLNNFEFTASVWGVKRSALQKCQICRRENDRRGPIGRHFLPPDASSSLSDRNICSRKGLAISQTSRLAVYQTSRIASYKTSRLPAQQAIRLQGYKTSRLAGYQTSRLPDQQAIKLVDQQTSSRRLWRGTNASTNIQIRVYHTAKRQESKYKQL